MGAVTITKGSALFQTEDPVKQLYLILKGSFEISFPGGRYTIGKGDVAGICEADSDLHATACTALEDSSVMAYPCSGLSALEALFTDNADYAVLFTRSAFRQGDSLLRAHERTQLYCSNLYTAFTQDYAFYTACCARNQQSPQTPAGLSEFVPLDEDSPEELFSSAFYEGIQRILASPNASVLSGEPAVLTGLFAGTCGEYRRVLSAFEGLAEYQKQALSLYLDGNGGDLFGFCTSLFQKLNREKADAAAVVQRMNGMIRLVSESPCADRAMLGQRVTDFKAVLKMSAGDSAAKPGSESDTDGASQNILEKLKGSLSAILDYAGASDEMRSDFTKLITQYRSLADPNATDDSTRLLRQRIAAAFYKLYAAVFFKAAEDHEIPLPVRMFLYFGYADEELAGAENAVCLAGLADRLAKSTNDRVYTFYDWLLAILAGKKGPSRNEFDHDYSEYLHSQKVTGKITAAEETALSGDMKKRVEYELENMFPSVNKIAFGRISTFCPVFSDHNMLKHADTSYVSASALCELLDDVEKVDFDAFYREYVYTNTAAGIPKEFFHVRVLPDFILMPCVGTRGVMWQEIEGKRRTTPARMMLPIFYLEDLRSAVVRLTGEYRWEMCKRIQGARWNDVSERSLTSEYFDYIQFYRKNHDLSADAKERIKSALQKARGSFKEMFVRDYITYILFESTGSPRLTKPARSILFAYCPFARQTRDALQGNPIYKETLEHFSVQRTQQLHKLALLEKRVENSGSELPEELAMERAYYEN